MSLKAIMKKTKMKTMLKKCGDKNYLTETIKAKVKEWLYEIEEESEEKIIEELYKKAEEQSGKLLYEEKYILYGLIKELKDRAGVKD